MIKTALINFIAKHLFKLVTESDFLRIDNNAQVSFRGKLLNSIEREAIVVEAKNLHANEMWKLLQNEMVYVANKKMFYDSSTTDDILAGKMVLWTLDVMQKKIDKLSRLR